MKKDEFINTALEQIRCENVKEPLKQELEAHIDDQTAAYLSSGIPEEEAEEKAVESMGDPIETGIRLDSVHRPKFPWTTALTAFILLSATAATGFLLKEYFNYSNNTLSILAGIIAGTVTAAAFYFIDYTVFMKAPKIAYGAALLIMTAYIIFSSGIEHTIYAANFGSLLLIPFICGFAFSMRGKSWGGFILTCLLAVIPPMLIFLYAPSISAAKQTGYTVLAIMTVIVAGNGFRINKKKAYLFMYIPVFICAVSFFYLCLNRNSTYEYRQLCLDYVKEVFSSAKIFGSGTHNITLYNPDENLILKAAVGPGLLMAAVIVILCLLLPIIMLIKAHRIKNSFGRVVAFAIGIVFLFMSLSVILSNFGITAGISGTVKLPLTAGDPANCIACGALTGIFMSVCGRADIMPERKIQTTVNDQ